MAHDSGLKVIIVIVTLDDVHSLVCFASFVQPQSDAFNL